MKHEYYFMAGLPRSGVTLLKTLLDQNPKIHAGPPTPMMELVYHSSKYFIDSESHGAFPNSKAAYNLISKMIDNYYFDIEKPIIIDHNRAWPSNIELLKTYITPNPKIICTVRDVLDILTSFITLMNKNSDQISYIDEYLISKGYPCTDEMRCQHLMSWEGLVGQSLWVLYRTLFMYNDGSHLLLVEYEDIVNNPDGTMKRIYDFLELDYYQHDYNYIDDKNPVNDKEWNLKDMHKVRKELKKISKDPKDILSEAVLHNFSNFEFWKNKNHNFKVENIA